MSAETPPIPDDVEPVPVPLGPAIVAALVHAVLLVLYLVPWHFDLSALVCAADAKQGQPGYEVVSITRGAGYDGQFYFLLAQQPPWQRRADRNDIDTPARQLRVLYPALGWFLSTGDPQRLLFILPMVNLLAIGLLAYAGSVLAQGRGLSPWWGVLLPLAVNAGLPLFRDLTDVLALALIALVLVGWLSNWSPGSLFGLALASLLAREVALLPLAALGLTALCQRKVRVAAAFTLAGVFWLAWAGYVGWMYNEWPMLPTDGNLGRPLSAFAAAWQHGAGPTSSRLERAKLLLTLALPPLVLLALLWRRGVEPGLLLVAGAGVVLILAAGQSIWEDYWSYARVLTLLPLVTWLACIYNRSPRLAAVLTLAGGITLATVVRGFIGVPA
jgi:hypothetical protein